MCIKRLAGIWILLCIFILNTIAQQIKQIEILNTDVLEYNKYSGSDAKKLIGNVRFQHENAIMYCDSAYFFTEQNRIEAFGNVSIFQGDTLMLYGKYLQYDGNSKFVQIRKDVKLVDKQTILTTQYLDYDISQQKGYYLNQGNILNNDNKLKSIEGYYFTRQKLFFFKGNVEIRNPKYIIRSDTLKYNTVSRIAYFFGPTHINSAENYIYCENGWYNTQKNISKFYRNAFLSSEKRMLKGDSLYYDRNISMGKAFKNVQLIDSSRNIILKGHYALYIEKPEYAFITDSTMMILYNEKDSMFLHADTLVMKTIQDTAQNKIIQAFYRVKFFKSDLQGMADSIVYRTSDSTLYMFRNPVLWSGDNQIFADHIALHFANQMLHSAVFTNNSFIIAREDTNKFSQVKGKNMKGFFKNNELYRLNVNGNGQTIYYVKDQNKIIGANVATCSQIDVLVNNRKISKIKFLTNPDAIFYPLNKIPEEEKILKGFIWYDKHRPKTINDIFTRNP